MAKSRIFDEIFDEICIFDELKMTFLAATDDLTCGTVWWCSEASISMSTTWDISKAANRLFRPNTSADTDQFHVILLKAKTPTASRLLPTQSVNLAHRHTNVIVTYTIIVRLDVQYVFQFW